MVTVTTILLAVAHATASETPTWAYKHAIKIEPDLCLWRHDDNPPPLFALIGSFAAWATTSDLFLKCATCARHSKTNALTSMFVPAIYFDDAVRSAPTMSASRRCWMLCWTTAWLSWTCLVLWCIFDDRQANNWFHAVKQHDSDHNDRLFLFKLVRSFSTEFYSDEAPCIWTSTISTNFAISTYICIESI